VSLRWLTALARAGWPYENEHGDAGQPGY
jgi:hypothetical protein